jgi:hypothetical protein
MTMVYRVMIAFNLIVVARGRYLDHVDAGYSPRLGWLYRVYWFVGQNVEHQPGYSCILVQTLLESLFGLDLCSF